MPGALISGPVSPEKLRGIKFVSGKGKIKGDKIKRLIYRPRSAWSREKVK